MSEYVFQKIALAIFNGCKFRVENFYLPLFVQDLKHDGSSDERRPMQSHRVNCTERTANQV